MNIIDLALILSGILSIPVFLVVLVKNPKNPLNLSFSVFILNVIVWAFAIAFFRLSKTQEPALFWSRMIYVSGSIVPSAIFYFSYTLVNGKFPEKIWTILLVTVPFIFFIPLFNTNLWIERIILDDQGNSVILGPVYIIWAIYLGIIYNTALVILIRGMMRLKGNIRSQIRYVLLASMLPMVIGIVPNVILPQLGNYRLIYIGPFVNVAMALIITYAILKHRLMDIRLVVARSITYILLAITLGLLYAGGFFLITSYITNVRTSTSNIVSSTILALIIAYSFQPLLRLFEDLTDNIFYKGHFHSNELLKKISRILASTLDLEDLTASMFSVLKENLRFSKAAIFVLGARKIEDVFGDRSTNYSFPTFPELKDLAASGRSQIFEEMEEGRLKKIMRKYVVSVFVPLSTHERTVGYLLLGEKESGDIYFDKDLGVLEILSTELAVALSNAQAFKKIQEFSHTLEQKVEERTLELRKMQKRELEKAQEVIRLRDEFVFIATHELRTPVTVINGFVSLIKDEKIKMDKDTLENFDAIEKANQRLNHLVDDLLEIARTESGTIELELTKVDFMATVKSVVSQVASIAQEKRVILDEDYEIASAIVEADEQKLRDVLENLLSNAIKYNKPAGRVVVKSAVSGKHVILEISDTGYGIPLKDHKKVFSKFFRAKTEGTEDVEGTGLGLFITKMLVEKMKGEIGFESVEGKGSVFKVSLPLARAAN
ncbi:MAG TPA: ATP-binding protein [Patescibacteria group bacterium]|nr:ATP-binding protein [Patescibacteria group bacterium]